MNDEHTPEATISVACPIDSLEQSSDGRVSGIIFWDFNGTPFPEVGWFDFPARTMSMWINAIYRLQSNASSVESCHFMDGPFVIRVEEVGSRAICEGRDRRRAGEPAVSWTGTAADIHDAVGRAANALYKTCLKRGFLGADVSELRDALSAGPYGSP